MTKRDLKRFDALRRIGCICCRLLGIENDQIDIHHVVSGGYRKGHQNTLPLCVYHHRGEGYAYGMGPSLASGSKPFHARFGTQAELLAKVNGLIEGKRL